MGSHDFISCHVCITSYYFQDRLTSTQKCVQIYQDVAANLTESSESLLCFCFSKLYFRNIIHVASCPLTNKREHNFKISLFLHLFLSGCACLYILVNIYIYIYIVRISRNDTTTGVVGEVVRGRVRWKLTCCRNLKISLEILSFYTCLNRRYANCTYFPEWRKKKFNRLVQFGLCEHTRGPEVGVLKNICSTPAPSLALSSPVTTELCPLQRAVYI